MTRRHDSRAQRLILSVLLAASASAQTGSRVDDAVQRAFPGAEHLDPKVVVLSAPQRAAVTARTGIRAIPRLLRVIVAHGSDGVLGYAIADDVPGKSRPITTLTVVNPGLQVRHVEILAYRESHGGEVKRTAWRAQFEGKNPDSTLRVGRDIRNIAGATISCRSVTDGVRRTLAMLAVADLPGKGTAGPPIPGLARRNAAAAQPLRQTRMLMGTALEITVAEPLDGAARAIDAAFAEVARIEGVISTWRDDSALSALHRSAGRAPAQQPATLMAFLAACNRWTQRTDGAFDATLGPVVTLWRRAAQTGVAPTEREIATALGRTGQGALQLDVARQTAALCAGAGIDAGGLGKGFALDRAARRLRDHGVRRALLNFGGQILALGDGVWPVTLRGPDGAPGATVRCPEGSLATTADYERGLVIAGHRHSHILDPRTGRPVTSMLAVSVFAADATTADALSTALFAMGWDEAVAYCGTHDLTARLHATDHRALVTPAFQRLEAATR